MNVNLKVLLEGKCSNENAHSPTFHKILSLIPSSAIKKFLVKRKKESLSGYGGFFTTIRPKSSLVPVPISEPHEMKIASCLLQDQAAL